MASSRRNACGSLDQWMTTASSFCKALDEFKTPSPSSGTRYRELTLMQVRQLHDEKGKPWPVAVPSMPFPASRAPEDTDILLRCYMTAHKQPEALMQELMGLGLITEESWESAQMVLGMRPDGRDGPRNKPKPTWNPKALVIKVKQGASIVGSAVRRGRTSAAGSDESQSARSNEPQTQTQPQTPARRLQTLGSSPRTPKKVSKFFHDTPRNAFPRLLSHLEEALGKRGSASLENRYLGPKLARNTAQDNNSWQAEFGSLSSLYLRAMALSFDIKWTEDRSMFDNLKSIVPSVVQNSDAGLQADNLDDATDVSIETDANEEGKNENDGNVNDGVEGKGRVEVARPPTESVYVEFLTDYIWAIILHVIEYRKGMVIAWPGYECMAQQQSFESRLPENKVLFRAVVDATLTRTRDTMAGMGPWMISEVKRARREDCRSRLEAQEMCQFVAWCHKKSLEEKDRASLGGTSQKKRTKKEEEKDPKWLGKPLVSIALDEREFYMLIAMPKKRWWKYISSGDVPIIPKGIETTAGPLRSNSDPSAADSDWKDHFLEIKTFGPFSLESRETVATFTLCLAAMLIRDLSLEVKE